MRNTNRQTPLSQSTAPSLESFCQSMVDQEQYGVLDLGGGQTLVTWGSGEVITEQIDWRARLRTSSSREARPWSSGWMGWISYEAGRTFEQMPEPIAGLPLPEVCLWRHEGALIHHSQTGIWSIEGTPRFQREAEYRLDRARGVQTPPLRPGLPTPRPAGEEAAFKAMVDEALKAIAAGEIYQVNLAWEIRDLPVQSPIGSYLALRVANPSQRSAFVRAKEWTLLSNSPELFLELKPSEHGLCIRSVPIKGTIESSEVNAEGRLRNSPKERAELTMITDLVRNDLGRVACAGSVQASKRRLRLCGDLLHAEQEITAKARNGCDAIDILTASFPPGSVTGAPKVRAMEMIHQLESGPRGAYTGTIGSFFDDGSAHLNVAIRTATIHEGRARFHVGAGIVADSSPDGEWSETLSKGNMLARWLTARR